MKKLGIKVLSVVLAVFMVVGMFPMCAIEAKAAGQVIVNLNGISGSLYTDSTSLAQKLDVVFSGNIPIYTNSACTNPINVAVGTRSVRQNRDANGNTIYDRFVRPYWGMSSCFAYAQAVYNYLFDDFPPHRDYSNSIRIPARESDSLKRYNITYSDFVTWGIKTGTYMRTSGHSLIILSYSKDKVNYIDGNGDGGGLVAIRECTWNEFNTNLRNGKANRYLDHIVVPRNDYYYNTFFEGVYLTETPCNKYFQTVKDDVIVRDGPGKKYAENRRIASKGTVVHFVAQYINEYDHIWYKTEDGKWIYSERLTPRTKYTIKYNLNGGGGNIPSQTKYKDSNINLTFSQPTKRNYIFLGWSTDKNAKKPEYLSGAMYNVNKSVTLYAIYRPELTVISLSNYGLDLNLDGLKAAQITATLSGWVPDSYVYVVESTNGNVTSSIGSTVFNKTTINLTATKPGHDLVNIKVYSGIMVAYATVSVNISEEYVVSYNANGGTGAPTTQKKIYNENLSLSANVPARAGYDFMGWSTSSTATSPEYGPGDSFKLNKDTKLYAVWEKSKEFTYDWDSANSTLTIYGEGNMPSYGMNTEPSWGKYYDKAKKLVVDSGVKSIGSFAFYGFKELTDVSLATSVTSIGNYGFGYCSKLKSVKGAQKISIGAYAFAKCINLKDFSYQSTYALAMSNNTINTIGAFAFEGCTSLETYNISDTTTEIGESAFQGCTALKELSIPDSVTNIDDTAFFNCSNLTEVNIPENVTAINDGVFHGCSSLLSVSISENVTEIGDQAFSGCTAIESVSIPETVENIGDSVFSNCSSLATVELPDDIITLGDGMFSGCTALQSIEIPYSVTNLGDGTFTGCTSLEDINIPEGVNSIGNSLFDGCSSLTSIEIPDSVGAIDSYAFYECTSLEDIVLSENLTEIGSCAFAECTSLQSVVVPESVTTLGMGAFMNCANLDEISFTNNAISIDDEAFAGCTALQSIEIPEQSTFVSQSAFSECSSQLSITCYSTSDALSGIEQNNVNCNIIYPVSGISLNVKNANLNKDETLQLVATLSPSNATNTNMIWISENEEIATVDSNGLVTSTGSGETVIKAISEDGEFIASCVVNCKIPVEGISIRDKYEQLYVGNALVLDYDFAPVQPTNINVSWQSSNSDVVSVNDEGLITVNGVGTATITVTTEDGGYSDSFTVDTTEYIQVEQITLDKTSIELKVGDTASVISTVYPANATDNSIKCYSTNESVATIDAKGNVVAISVGETSIVYYTVDGLEVYCTVTVVETENNYIFHIQSPSMTTIRHKDGIKLHAKVEGTAPAGSYVVWTASNNKFKTEEINNGNSLKIVSNSNGNTTFTAKLYNADGEILATDSIEMKSKAGFFDKLGSFFRSIFRGTKVYEK